MVRLFWECNIFVKLVSQCFLISENFPNENKKRKLSFKYYIYNVILAYRDHVCLVNKSLLKLVCISHEEFPKNGLDKTRMAWSNDMCGRKETVGLTAYRNPLFRFLKSVLPRLIPGPPSTLFRSLNVSVNMCGQSDCLPKTLTPRFLVWVISTSPPFLNVSRYDVWIPQLEVCLQITKKNP